MKRGVDKIKKDNSNILAYIIRSLSVVFVVIILYNFFLLAFSAKTDKEAKYLFGFRAYIITTDSMKPSVNVGDIILIQKTENEDLFPNDVVTYRLSKDLERVTHRIIDKTEDIYITKGDNNKLEDKDIVRYENIEGKVVFKIPFIGKFFLNAENLFYTIFLSVIILTIYLYQRRFLNKSQIRRIKKKQADALRKELLMQNTNTEINTNVNTNTNLNLNTTKNSIEEEKIQDNEFEEKSIKKIIIKEEVEQKIKKETELEKEKIESNKKQDIVKTDNKKVQEIEKAGKNKSKKKSNKNNKKKSNKNNKNNKKKKKGKNNKKKKK